MPENKDNKILNVPNLRFPEFEGEWQEKRLSDIADLSKGIGISKDQLSADGEPCILYGELYTKYKSETIKEVISKTNIDNTKLVKSKANDVIIPCSGETAEEIATARCVLKDDILLGGDLNIIRLHGYDGSFMSYQLNGKRKYDIAKVAQGVSVVHLYGEHLKNIKTINPSLNEQKKIANLLSLLDERISTQNKIIEDLKKLRSAIIEREYTFKVQTHSHIGDFIEQNSNRNKDNIIQNVLSVSNRQGFIRQREQFEDRSIASDDTSNYKIVARNDFAFNPARINVGSIARLTTFEKGIVSPMYICFHTKNSILPEYLSFYFETKQFFSEIQKRLEGSVRQCLSYEGLCNIPFFPPVIEDQRRIGKRLFTLVQKFNLEMTFLEMLQKQKTYLLRQMFI
ncbi:restriction endonuclease subunit S [Porphyromonas gingivalis]|uniref:restriction endonuclease subunit S n=1 Tax=Porphyromonas gingivalis TaxID=837 RepID=UPI000C18BFC2|nr:restriction endonuclease subunit S [Porphyromonas gingivalis]ATS02791.1 restriction endonuclease subunit S [Porphyromonas gingivalis]